VAEQGTHNLVTANRSQKGRFFVACFLVGHSDECH